MLDAGEEITVADLMACLERQGMTEADITEGCAALWRTGWGEELWMKDNARFNSGEPGIGVEAGEWLAAQGHFGRCGRLLGDRGGAEPGPEPGLPGAPDLSDQERHPHSREWCALDHLAADGVYKFAFIFSTLPIKGATGSPGNPIAVV